MSDAIDGVLTLQVWLSPAFPVGGFTYSHGLEWAIEDGTVTSADALRLWLVDIVEHGAGRSDAILLAHAHAAVTAGDLEALAEVIEVAAAFQPTKERRLEATAQGTAFVRAVTDTWAPPGFVEIAAAVAERLGGGPVPWTHAVAVGVATAAAGIDVGLAAPAFLQAFAAGIVSAGVRAVPLGQSDGLRVTRALGPLLRRIAAAAIGAPLDEVGGASVVADIASMRHETQYTRLFRS